MGRTGKFVRNLLASGGLHLIMMISGFIVPKIMIDVYGSEINGLVTSITMLVGYIMLVEMGLGASLVYSLYKPIAAGDSLEINSILVASRNFYYRTGFLFFGIVAVASALYPMLVSCSAVSDIEICILFFLVAANGVMEFFTLAKYRALLTADQKTYVAAIATSVQVLTQMIIIAVFAYGGFSIVEVRVLVLISLFLRSIILWGYCKVKYPFLDFSAKPNYGALSNRYDAFYFQMAGVAHNTAPILIVTFMMGFADVSVYSVYNLVYMGVLAILSIFLSGVHAGFGDLIARGEREKFKRAFNQFEFSYGILISAIYATMWIAYMPFMKVYIPHADINYQYPEIAALMTINGIAYNLKTPYGMLTNAAGKFRESRWQISVQVAIEVVCGIIFCYIWGINGIIIASILSNVYRDIDFAFFTPKHLTHFGFGYSIKIWARTIFCIALSVAAFRYVPDFSGGSYIMWALYAVSAFLAAAAITLFINILFDFEMFKGILKRVKFIV